MGKFLVTDFEGVIGWIVPKRRVCTDLAVTINVLFVYVYFGAVAQNTFNHCRHFRRRNRFSTVE
jgi:hypothetical protein